jgi:hypothetical protein
MDARMGSDLGLVIEAVEDQRICGVVARDAKRVARRITTATQFSEHMAEMGARMWLSEMRREVDWDNDFLLLLIKQAEAHTDHRDLVDKMLKARRRSWLEEGRGWPGLKRYGLRRNAQTKYLEWDPAQWPVIKFIHYEYSRLEGDPRTGKSGYVRLAESLAADPADGGWGIDLSPDKIRQILRDPIYVDGSYAVLYNKAHLVACRPAKIPVEERIPLDLFQENQELLATRKGPNRRNPVGTFLLNGINVVCATCESLTNEKYPGKHPRFKGREQAGTAPAYYALPFRGDCCHRFTFPKLVLEEAVVRALWQLADDEKLQADWAARALPGVGPAPPVFSEGQAAAMRREIVNLEKSRQDLVTEQSRQAAAGEAPSTAVRAIIDQICADLETRRNRLEHAARQEELRSRHDTSLLDRRRRRTLSKALREVLTIEMPEDLRARVRRAAVIEACLSKVVLHRTATGLKLELLGPLVPKALLDAGTDHKHLPVSPLNAAREILDSHLRQQEARPQTSSEGATEGVTGTVSDGAPSETSRVDESAESGWKMPALREATGREPISTSLQVQTWQEVQTWEWSEVSGAVVRGEMPAAARVRRDAKIKDPRPSFHSPLVAIDLWRLPETRFPQWQVEAVQKVSSALGNRVLSCTDYSFYRDLHPELHLPRADIVREIIDAGTYLAPGVVPTVLRNRRRRSADWPFERCLESIRLARERLPEGLPLSEARYRALAKLHDDLASPESVGDRARERDLTFSELRAIALGRESDGGRTKTMSRADYQARLRLVLQNGGRPAAESRRRHVRSEFAVRRSIPDDELEGRLRKLAAGRNTMPSYAEFVAAGEKALYMSIVLYGGIVLWAERLDLMYFGRAGGEPGRRYVEQSIERALRDFCGDRQDWPGTQAFKRAGLRWLYRRVCNHGGSRLWAERLGLVWRIQR